MAGDARYVLVVDGGGTKTLAGVARLTDADVRPVLLSRATSSTSDLCCIDGKWVAQGLEHACMGALAKAGVDKSQIVASVLGISGATREVVRGRLSVVFSSYGIGGVFEVVPDLWLLPAAVATDGPVIVLVSGTGSVACIRNDANYVSFVGGWGYLLGDDGSGYTVARSGIRQLLRELEQGRRLSRFAQAMSREIGDTIAMIKNRVYDEDRRRANVADVAQVVARLSDREEPIAVRIIESAADSLADLLALASQKVASPGVPVGISGGMILGCNSLYSALQRKVAERNLLLGPWHRIEDPLAGGLVLAARLAAQSSSGDHAFAASPPIAE